MDSTAAFMMMKPASGWTMGYSPAMLAAMSPFTGVAGGAATAGVPTTGYVPQMVMQSKTMPMFPQSYAPGMMVSPMLGMQAAVSPWQVAGQAGVSPWQMLGMQIQPTAQTMMPTMAAQLPAALAGLSMKGARGALSAAPVTAAVNVPDTQGAFRIPGFSIAVDTPFIQGGVNWPGIQGAMNWPGMQGVLQLPGIQAAGMGGDAQNLLRLPGLQVQLMPDSPMRQ